MPSFQSAAAFIALFRVQQLLVAPQRPGDPVPFSHKLVTLDHCNRRCRPDKKNTTRGRREHWSRVGNTQGAMISMQRLWKFCVGEARDFVIEIVWGASRQIVRRFDAY